MTYKVSSGTLNLCSLSTPVIRRFHRLSVVKMAFLSGYVRICEVRCSMFHVKLRAKDRRHEDHLDYE